jgi:catechol 2,3-dioxygenase-like lactoylglutathione lyase family enzyme
MADEPRLTLQPMVHVERMEDSVGFFEALGAELVSGSRDGDWAELTLGGAGIGLLAHPPNPEQDEGTVELNFATDAPLAEVEGSLRAAGVAIVQGASDEAFGEQLQVKTPDGILVKINRLEPKNYE